MIIRSLFFTVEWKYILSSYHLVVMHEKLYFLDVSGNELCQLLIFGDFQVTDEFIQKHFIFDRFLGASNGRCIHGELEGNLSNLEGYVEGAIVGDDLFFIISILFHQTLECLLFDAFLFGCEELHKDVRALRIEYLLRPRPPAPHYIYNSYTRKSTLI